MKTPGSRGLALLALAALGMTMASGTGRAAAKPASHPTTVLSRPYTVTLGQMVAASTSTILQTMQPIDAPMMAISSGDKIEIWVLGARSSPDGARESLEDFRSKAWPRLTAMIVALYDVKLTDQMVTVVYRDRGEDNKEVIRWENGKYVEK